MTNSELLAKIKAEIERRKKENQKSERVEDSGAFYEDCDLLSILSTLEESEKPMNQDGLEEEIERYLHSLGVGYGGWVDGMEDDDLRGIARHFAKWGAEHAREQMLKEAVEGDYDCQYYAPTIFLDRNLEGIKDGDKVRVIVLPKEDKNE